MFVLKESKTISHTCCIQRHELRDISDLVDISGKVAKHTLRFKNVSDILLKKVESEEETVPVYTRSADMRGLNDV